MEVIDIIKDYPIAKKALKYIILNNKSNSAPYHNLNHLLTVTKHAYSALRFNNNFYGGCMEDVLVACLFHDYNHSKGEFKDDVNVKVAKEEMIKFLNSLDSNPLDTDFMEHIIDATQYPYIISSEDLCPYQKIIRDCDLMQIYEYNWLKQNILGLSEEMNISVKNLIEGTVVFLSTLKPLSEYGKYMHEMYFENTLEKLYTLEKIME